jgi:hypothetical protein
MFLTQEFVFFGALSPEIASQLKALRSLAGSLRRA